MKPLYEYLSSRSFLSSTKQIRPGSPFRQLFAGFLNAIQSFIILAICINLVRDYGVVFHATVTFVTTSTIAFLINSTVGFSRALSTKLYVKSLIVYFSANILNSILLNMFLFWGISVTPILQTIIWTIFVLYIIFMNNRYVYR